MWERPDDIVIEREDLYKEVWSMPMSQLAKKYNISDVGLAKICKKMVIPRPGRGFWAKAKHGAKVRLEPLKPISSKGKTKIVLNRAMLQREEINRNPEILEAIAFEKQSENKIAIAEKLQKPHPLIAETKRQLVKAQLKAGRVELTPTCIDIRVSKRTLSRAVLVMDAVVKAAEQRGYTVAVEVKDGKNVTFASVGKDRAFFYIEETIKSTPHVETRAEKKARERLDYSSYHPERIAERRDFYAALPGADYHPQGTLSLRLDHYYPYNVQRSWADGKRQRVEACLNKFFIGLQKVIDYERDRRLTREREEQERRDAAERRRIFEEKLSIEKAKVERLEAEMEGLENSRRIRAYIATMQATPNYGPDMAEWLTWANQYADHLDPTAEFRIEVLEEA